LSPVEKVTLYEELYPVPQNAFRLGRRDVRPKGDPPLAEIRQGFPLGQDASPFGTGYGVYQTVLKLHPEKVRCSCTSDEEGKQDPHIKYYDRAEESFQA